jgi:hypothetical protein
MTNQDFVAAGTHLAKPQPRRDPRGGWAEQRMEEHTMKSRDRFRFTRLTITVAILTLLAGAANAGAAEPGWQIKAGGVWVQPALSYTLSNPDGTNFSVDSDNAVGLGFAL